MCVNLKKCLLQKFIILVILKNLTINYRLVSCAAVLNLSDFIMALASVENNPFCDLL